MDFYNEYFISESRSQNGVWVPFRDGIEFLIARGTNPDAMRMMRRELKKHERKLNAQDDASFDLMKRITIDVTAKHILLGWKGPVKYQGADMEYSEANAKKLLAMDGFREWVDTQARDEDRYKEVQDEEEEKNSVK